ncbi:MAG: hypothetical protein JW995_07855 [Melioribacteraceae bacterium]|nr:hypothetical protein [Melioribacteraceae bacterium]
MKRYKMSKAYYPPMHTAEHILNQCMVRKFGCERSFSNHIEKKKSKCDYKFERDLKLQELKEIEECVNAQIARNLVVTEEFIPYEQAQIMFNLERLPKNAGSKIRIIKIGDFDSCPCIGEHVGITSEIGYFKIISTSLDNNVLRIRFGLL